MAEVKVLVHFEVTPDTREATWWAESPDLPGFSASAESLSELRGHVQRAFHEMVVERGGDPYDLRIELRLIGPEEEASEGEQVLTEIEPSHEPDAEGGPAVERVLEQIA